MAEKEGIGKAKAASLNISKAGRFSIAGVAVTASAADLNLISGIAATGSVAKVVKVPLAAVDAAAGCFSWANPEAGAIFVTLAALDVTTIATGAGTVSVGGQATSVSGANLIDTVDVHSATGTFTNISTPGSGGKTIVKVPAGGFVTGSKASGALAGLAGSAYLSYFLA